MTGNSSPLLILSGTPGSGAGLTKCAASVISQAANRAHHASSYPTLVPIKETLALGAVPMAAVVGIVLILASSPLLYICIQWS